MKTLILLLIIGSLGGCVSFSARMQKRGCKLVMSGGAHTAYNPYNGQMWIAPGRQCYECVATRTVEQFERGERPTVLVCQ